MEDDSRIAFAIMKFEFDGGKTINVTCYGVFENLDNAIDSLYDFWQNRIDDWEDAGLSPGPEVTYMDRTTALIKHGAFEERWAIQGTRYYPTMRSTVNGRV